MGVAEPGTPKLCILYGLSKFSDIFAVSTNSAFSLVPQSNFYQPNVEVVGLTLERELMAHLLLKDEFRGKTTNRIPVD